jgi:hypothetical protein
MYNGKPWAECLESSEQTIEPSPEDGEGVFLRTDIRKWYPASYDLNTNKIVLNKNVEPIIYVETKTGVKDLEDEDDDEYEWNGWEGYYFEGKDGEIEMDRDEHIPLDILQSLHID